MSTPVPGWYADPAGTPQLRWWDGTQWTQQYRPANSEQASRKRMQHPHPRLRPRGPQPLRAPPPATPPSPPSHAPRRPAAR